METFWNGEPCVAERCEVIVGKSLRPTWWCAGLEGTRRKAVEIIYGGDKFYIDDESGHGWYKVTEGRGSPRVASASLPDSSVRIIV